MRYVILFLILGLTPFAVVGCGEVARVSPTTTASASISTSVPTATPTATPMSVPTLLPTSTVTPTIPTASPSISVQEATTIQENFQQGYDLIEPSSVEDEEALFDYFRSVTGRFTAVTFRTPPIKMMPEDFRKELFEKYPFLSQDDGPPINLVISASKEEAFGHGLIIGSNVLTVSHVIEDNGATSIIENSFLKGLPLSLISTVHSFLPLREENRLEPRVPYVLEKIITYQPHLMTWLSIIAGAKYFEELEMTKFPDHNRTFQANWKKLRVDTFVYVVTYGGIKEGVIVPPGTMFDKWDPSSEFAFVISLRDGSVFQNGDSGAPVFVIREGIPYFAGQVEVTHSDPAKQHFGAIAVRPPGILTIAIEKQE